MGTETRLATVIFGSFLLWFPVLTAFLRGEVDAGAAGLRFAVAMAVVWGGMALVGTIAAGYRSEPVTAEAGGVPQERRVTDRSSDRAPHAGAPAEDPTTSLSDGASDG